MLWLDLEAGVYRFTCPECKEGRSGAIGDRMVSVLRSVGVLDIDEIVTREMDELGLTI